MTDDAELSPYYNGTPWWQLTTAPGSSGPFGGERRIAAYLYFNVEVGGTFTMREIREALGRDGVPDNAEHLNRRLRNLRKQGWVFPSYKDRAGQDIETYVLKAKGNKLWLGEQTRQSTISAALQRQVFDRDLSRCVICGVGAGEPYPGEPDTAARLTAGHRTPGARLGDVSLDNLQTECSRCNEPARDIQPNPEVLAEVLAAVRQLGAADKRSLLAWLESGHRQRNKVDLAFDRTRRLAQSEREQVAQFLRDATGN
ncbi:HNH endonuclease [Mycolicibacter kumamotonensis]|uniref:HNH endonuclease n=1 Tax=Mycolicibacter kumamotonensis TaxID=354243 RepID=A0A7K3LGI1_9MYCO|nr:HNH endonuclease signature motif containing protein [Mycolicibacter kumamotonensis]NDJ91461.1 HNH endonuclease [Mycolicibacter kumamotonensis]